MQDFACEEPCDQTHSSERLDRFSITACLKQVCTDILFCFWPSFVSSGPDFRVLQPTVQPSTLPYGQFVESPWPHCTDIHSRLVTDVFLLLVSACVALDIAAPYEPTVALLLHVTHPRLVASSATQEAAAIWPHACAITQTTPCP